MREHPSPNSDARPEGAVPDALVIHYTGMRTAAEAESRLADPAARVSAHYLIDEAGQVVRMVDEAARAWHAGVSWWAGRAGVNDVSIGIELVNPGHEWGYRPFPSAQLEALVMLVRDIRSRWVIPPTRVLGHSDVAPARKTDPGEHFPWQHLAGDGLGAWPAAAEARRADPAVAARLLRAVGYGPAELPFAVLLRAFQRRYRPMQVDGWLDGQSMGLLTAVAGLYGSASDVE